MTDRGGGSTWTVKSWRTLRMRSERNSYSARKSLAACTDVSASPLLASLPSAKPPPCRGITTRKRCSRVASSTLGGRTSLGSSVVMPAAARRYFLTARTTVALPLSTRSKRLISLAFSRSRCSRLEHICAHWPRIGAAFVGGDRVGALSAFGAAGAGGGADEREEEDGGGRGRGVGRPRPRPPPRGRSRRQSRDSELIAVAGCALMGR